MGSPLLDKKNGSVHRTGLSVSIAAVSLLAPVFASTAQANSPAGQAEIRLAVTAAPDNGDPGQCGTTSTITVLRGQAVNLCYTVTNTGSVALHYQTLVGSTDEGRLLVHEPAELPPGGSYSYHRTVSAIGGSATYSGTWLASDVLPSFTVAPADFDFIDISATGIQTDSRTFNLPFPIRFYDLADAQTICLLPGGAIQLFAGQLGGFGSCGIYTMWDNSALPTDFLADPDGIPNGLSIRYPVAWAAVYWDYLGDFFMGNFGGIRYVQTIGTAPDRRFVAQWHLFHHLYADGNGASPGTVEFEAILEESTGAIRFQYQDTTFDDPAHPEWDRGGSATIGLQYGMDLFDSHLLNQPTLDAGTAIAWTPDAAVLVTSNTASATITTAAARIETDPAEIVATIEPGAATSVPLEIANTGNFALDWTIDESGAGGSAHGRSTGTGWIPRDVASRPEPLWPITPPWLNALSFHPADPPPSAQGIAASSYAVSVAGGPNGPVFRYELLPRSDQPNAVFDVTTLPDDRTWLAAGFVGNDFSRQFAISYPDSRLQTLSTFDGSITDIGPIVGAPDIAQWHGLKWDAATGNVYALGLDDAFVPYLFLLDVDNGQVTRIGEIASAVASGVLMIDIAIGLDGTMYGLDLTYDGLFSIDKTTAQAVPIGPIGFDANYSQSMDFDHGANVLYLAGYGEFSGGAMYTIDTGTGHATMLGSFRSNANYYGLSIASFSGACATPRSVPWLSVDPAAGSLPPGESSTLGVHLDAGALSAGVYEATLCLRSSDPTQPGATVPVRFTVGADAIFADGFE